MPKENLQMALEITVTYRCLLCCFFFYSTKDLLFWCVWQILQNSVAFSFLCRHMYLVGYSQAGFPLTLALTLPALTLRSKLGRNPVPNATHHFSQSILSTYQLIHSILWPYYSQRLHFLLSLSFLCSLGWIAPTSMFHTFILQCLEIF